MSKSKSRWYNCKVCDKRYNPWRPTSRFCSKSCAATGENNASYKHGHISNKKPSKTLSIWYGMRSRVNNPDEYHKKYYKDIKICERWNDFSNFLADMGECPGDEYSIDRIDNSGDYTPDNCRWATREQQMNNIRTNNRLTYKGTTLTHNQWAKRLGLGRGSVITKRLNRGWSVEKTLTTPLNPPQIHTRYLTYNNITKPIGDFSEQFGISKETISYRLDKLNWSVDKALTTPVRGK